MAGAPKGNNNAAKGKLWREALDKALKQYTSKPAGIERGQALFRIATKVVEQALEGQRDAIQEIGNRIDGKPHQSIEQQVTGEQTVHHIISDKPMSPDEWEQQYSDSVESSSGAAESTH